MSKKTKKNIWFIDDGHWQSNMLCGLDWTRAVSPQTSIPHQMSFWLMILRANFQNH
jgi:hypothetical protein